MLNHAQLKTVSSESSYELEQGDLTGMIHTWCLFCVARLYAFCLNIVCMNCHFVCWRQFRSGNLSIYWLPTFVRLKTSSLLICVLLPFTKGCIQEDADAHHQNHELLLATHIFTVGCLQSGRSACALLYLVQPQTKRHPDQHLLMCWLACSMTLADEPRANDSPPK